MNRLHHWVCGSGYWHGVVTGRILPWALTGVDLGADVLEIGPGYGSATDVLRGAAERLTCVEINPALAQGLRRKIPAANVSVVQGDGASLPFPDASFSGVICLTMLHHIPVRARQDRLFAEVARVLRPGGVFTGSDEYRGVLFRLIHIGDDFTPVNPASLTERLQRAGFARVTVDRRGAAFRFEACRA